MNIYICDLFLEMEYPFPVVQLPLLLENLFVLGLQFCISVTFQAPEMGPL